MFRPIRLYLKIYVNRMELLNLETGKSVVRIADPAFSGPRQALADVLVAELQLSAMLKQFGLKRGFFAPGLHLLIHQLELREGGLSQLEQRGLRDLGTMAGARIVHLVQAAGELSFEEAIAAFRDPAVAR